MISAFLSELDDCQPVNRQPELHIFNLFLTQGGREVNILSNKCTTLRRWWCLRSDIGRQQFVKMSNIDFQRLEFFRSILSGCSLGLFCNNSHLDFHNTSDDQELVILEGEPPWLRIVISVVYFIVATAGVLGNLLVMFLLYSTHTIHTGTINFFVFNLALAHLLFSLALPFWAVDIALDYSWPFSLATCKAVSLLTGVNVFASCFFLTAMSLTRYCFVATALRPRTSCAIDPAPLQWPQPLSGPERW